MFSKMEIVMAARGFPDWYVGVQQDGKVRDWETLKSIYDSMEPKPLWEALPQGNNLEAIKNGKWLRKDGTLGGTSVESLGTAWCGIFATYILRMVGFPVNWRANQGISPLKPYFELKSYAFANEIEPGDICVRGTNQHHFIVLRQHGGRLYSVDGNLPGQSIGYRDYSIAETVEAARKADISTAQKKKELSPAEFKQYVQNTSKYNFYFYRLKRK